MGDRVYVTVAGPPANSRRFLAKGARGVVTRVEPPAELLVVMEDGDRDAVRLPVAHVARIKHDPTPPPHE